MKLNPPEVPARERAAFSIREFAAIVGLGRSLLYGLIRDGSLRSVKVGRRRLIPAAEATALLARLAEARDAQTKSRSASGACSAHPRAP